MNLATSILQPGNTIVSNLSEKALALCAQARDFEEAGEFEEARGTISEFWQRIGERPRLEGLTGIAQAELLLRAGTLCGWIGSARQISGAQEIAKDLISESAGAFEKLGLVERVAEARIDLSICYWREGAFDEGRVSLGEALAQLGDMESEQRLRALLNRALIDRTADRCEDALQTHREAAPLFELSNNNTLKGKFHNEYALVLKNLGLAEHRIDYLDRALIEFSAASFHLEQANHKRFQGVVENNLGFLFVHLGRFEDAHKHLNRARAVAVALKDQGLVAQFDDTRARAFIAQGHFSKAESIARSSVKTLEEGDQLSMFAEALTTHGTALARMGSFSKSRASLEKAIQIARNAGDRERTGVAALATAEELARHLTSSELLAYYRIAESELVNSQHPEIENRLGKCARLLLAAEVGSQSNVATSEPDKSRGGKLPVRSEDPIIQAPSTLSLEEQVLSYEAELIKQALQTAEGSVTRAARTLGITHQGLAFILNGRHKNLLPDRKPVKPRRRSIIRYH